MNALTISPAAISLIAAIRADAQRLPTAGWATPETLDAMRDQAARLRCDAAALESELYHLSRAALAA